MSDPNQRPPHPDPASSARDYHPVTGEPLAVGSPAPGRPGPRAYPPPAMGNYLPADPLTDPYGHARHFNQPAPKRPLPREKSRPTWAGVVAVAVLTSVISTGFGYGLERKFSGHSPAAESSVSITGELPHTSSPIQPVVSSSGDSPDWRAVAEAVASSTVAIEVEDATGGAVGSGVVTDTDGHIVTNDHVVAGATKIIVTFIDGRMLKAELVGTDPSTDIAVIKVNHLPDGVKPATFGTSKDIVVGDPVAAIGNPLGLSQTMTTGIVSALNRPVSTEREWPHTNQEPVITNAIQVDASINPGNSGGPLFDAHGRVIGINSTIATLSKTSGSVGLGFAIPVELVQSIMQQLISEGHASHAFLGVSARPGHAPAAGERFVGAELMEIYPDTPAQKSGLRVGDVIVAINGERVVSAESLTGFVRQYRANDEVVVKLIRDKEIMEIKVNLMERPVG